MNFLISSSVLIGHPRLSSAKLVADMTPAEESISVPSRSKISVLILLNMRDYIEVEEGEIVELSEAGDEGEEVEAEAEEVVE